MSVSCFFDEEAVGDDNNHDKSSLDDEQSILLDDINIVEEVVNVTIPNDDNSENNESVEVISDATIEGLQPIIVAYQSIIRECVQEVFGISNPKAWQVMLIQSLVFDKDSNMRRVMCIRQTGDGKSLPMQCAATMIKHVTIIIVPLLSIGSEQSSSVYTRTNAAAGIYAEHLDSVREKEGIIQITAFLDNLYVDVIPTQTIILYISPNTISDSIWSPV